MLPTTIRRSIAALVLGAALTAGIAAARAESVIVSYDFQDSHGNFGTLPHETAENVTAEGWMIGVGTLDEFDRRNLNQAVAAIGWEGGNFFAFKLTVAPSYRLDLSSYSFEENSESESNGSGPTRWRLLIDGVPMADGPTTQNSFGLHEGALTLTGLSGAIVVQLEGTRSFNGSKEWRVDNFVLDGIVSAPPPAPPTHAPLPASFGLLSAALAGLAFISRRRAPPARSGAL